MLFASKSRRDDMILENKVSKKTPLKQNNADQRSALFCFRGRIYLEHLSINIRPHIGVLNFIK